MKRPRRLLLVCEEGIFGDQVLIGVEIYFRQRGNWEFHREPDRHPNMLPRLTMSLKEWKADGVIAQVRTPVVEKILKSIRVPVVNFSGAHGSSFPTVTMDNAAIGQMAARHFLDNGFRHFAYASRTGTAISTGQYDGFSREVARAGFYCHVLDELVSDDPLQRQLNWIRNHRKMARWLAKLPKPVALLCVYDGTAQDVFQLCRSMDLLIPDDVAILGVGNHPCICRMTTPPMSSIDVDCQRIGFEAARLLDHIFHKRKPSKSPILVAPREVIERQSSQWIPDGDGPIVQTLRYIRQHLAEPISAKALTRVSLLTRRAMDFHFEKLLGRTVSQEIKRQRVQNAKRLLSQTSMSIDAIAHTSGFNDSRALSRVFRAATGILPSKYRADMGRTVSRTGRLLQSQPFKASL